MFLYGCIIRCLVADNSDILHNGKPLSLSARRQRKQVVFMLLSVIVLFFICVVPFRFTSILYDFISDSTWENIGFEGYLNIMNFVRIMFYLNSAANPILYNVFSTKFRNAFKMLCKCKKHQARFYSERTMGGGNGAGENGHYAYKYQMPLRDSTSFSKIEF